MNKKQPKKTFSFSFGKQTRELSIPSDNLQKTEGFDFDYFVRPQGIRAVEEALNNPVGSLPLELLCQEKETVTLLVDDNTRPTPTAKILPLVIKKLIKVGIEKKAIKVVIAKGTHPALTDRELRRKIGSVSEEFEVIQHDCRDKENMGMVGRTSQGEVWMNQYAVQSDLRIGMGQLSLSPFAGISSGAKLWLPGISSVETIRQNHKLAKDHTSDFGMLENNVLRKDMERAASLAGDNFYLGIILNPKREIVSAVSGDVVKAQRQGAQELIKHISVANFFKADLGIINTSPYDHSLYHVLHKALVMKFFVKEGGNVFCLGYCQHGLGPEDFIQLLRKNVKEEKIEEKIRRDELMPDRGYISLRVKNFMKKFNLSVYTRKTLRDKIKKMGIPCLESLSEITEKLKNEKVFLSSSPVILPKSINK